MFEPIFARLGTVGVAVLFVILVAVMLAPVLADVVDRTGLLARGAARFYLQGYGSAVGRLISIVADRLRSDRRLRLRRWYRTAGHGGRRGDDCGGGQA